MKNKRSATMKTRILCICMLLLYIPCVKGQDKLYNFTFSGYRVVLVHSKEYKIEVSHPEWCSKSIYKGTLILNLKDANGRMPKDTVFLHTDKIENIQLNFSTLEMSQNFPADSIQLSLSAGSRGKANISSDRVKVNIGAGSELELSGNIRLLEGKVEGNSHLRGKNLNVQHTDLKVKGNSTANVLTSAFTQEAPKNKKSNFRPYIIAISVLLIIFSGIVLYRKRKRPIKKYHHSFDEEIALFKKTGQYQTLLNKEPEIDSEYLSIDNQQQLYERLNAAFPSFIIYIKEVHPSINKEDIFFCILSALKFKTKTIAYCLRTTTGALRTRKNRIKKDMPEKYFQYIFGQE